MKRLAVLVIALCWLGKETASAQQPLNVAGYGGFGFESTSYQSQGFPSQRWNELTTELGLVAGGFIYNPALVNYNLDLGWDGNNTSVGQETTRLNGLNYDGNFNFLPDRPYPFSFFFEHNHINNGGSLLPAFSTVTSLWGLRGEIRKPRWALIRYDFGLGGTSNYLPSQTTFDTHQRFATITAVRKLDGWDFRVSDNYLRTASTFSDFLTSINTLIANASRHFGDRIYVDLSAAESNFSSGNLTGANSSHSAVTNLNGNMTWKHTPKLDSYYNFNLSRNASNTLGLLLAANGEPLPSGALGLESLASTSETAAAGLSYRPTSSLALNSNLAYSHNGLPAQTVAALSASGQTGIATDVLSATLGASYHHKLRKLEFSSSDSVNFQRFTLLNGGPDSAVGYNLDNRLTGGNVRKLRYAVSYRYTSQTEPFFFNVLTDIEQHAALNLDSDYFRLVKFTALADIGTTRMDLLGSNIKLDTNSYSLSATLKKLSVYASRGLTNSEEAIFGAVLSEPGGGAVIPASLLNPSVFSTVMAERIGLTFWARRNLQIESRYTDYNYLFRYQGAVPNLNKEFDTIASYKFGRFTFIAGYGNGNSENLPSRQHVDQVYFRVRFPFHIFGGG